jgi:hypothetical protein
MSTFLPVDISKAYPRRRPLNQTAVTFSGTYVVVIK